MGNSLIVIGIILILAAGIFGYFLGRGNLMQMGGQVIVPQVRGYYDGRDILFIHTEASDQDVAQMLTMMMNSPVIFVPGLTKSAAAVGNVYVFKNGVRGGGPFGFQPDVFDSVPSDKNYTPLRNLTLVTWKEGVLIRELKSLSEIEEVLAKGEIEIGTPGIIINMPVISWPGGSR